MKRLWRLFSTIFTVSVIVALLVGGVMWKADKFSLKDIANAIERRDKEDENKVEEKKDDAVSRVPEIPEKLSEEEAKTWYYRLQLLQKEFAKRDNDIQTREGELKKKKTGINSLPIARTIKALISNGTDNPKKISSPRVILIRRIAAPISGSAVAILSITLVADSINLSMVSEAGVLIISILSLL